jgi:DNA polymerase-3 subunit chi
MSSACQVDFYVLKSPALDARQLACRLALMAWERGHRITVTTASEADASALNELMWANPSGRFLPHEITTPGQPALAPIRIAQLADLKEADVVINLCPQPVPEPGRFTRLLEIVPPAGPGLEASREKFRYYRDQGITPQSHDIKQ